MSKPISFGFGKAKAKGKGFTIPSAPPKKVALSTDLEHEHDDETVTRAEIITGFDVGAVSARSNGNNSDTNTVRVIENSGNADWRTRGRRNDGVSTGVVLTERNEVSTVSGLQFAAPTNTDIESGSSSITLGTITAKSQTQPQLQLAGEQTTAPEDADAEAIAALLANGTRSRLPNAIITSADNSATTVSAMTTLAQPDDFKADLSSRPDSSTLADYTAMPVEEFGLALVRGMGKKRRANGEIIIVEPSKEDDTKKTRKQEGFLGIGARPIPGGVKGVELGAWGKADMKKNSRGEGFFTPVMVRLANGEMVTEEELERRKAAAVKQREGKESRNGHGHGHRRDEEGSDREVAARRRRRSRSREDSRRRKNEDRGGGEYRAINSSRDRNRDRDKDKERERERERDRNRHRDKHSHDQTDDKSRDRDRNRNGNGRKRSYSPRRR